ncbi:hypothetical protein C5960_00785, partial [Cronobacter sakazakii]|uniref:hypothetical protein n=1 Tax=Cronobacter sakazakii TaxID=28141 RepID=UPI000D42A468
LMWQQEDAMADNRKKTARVYGVIFCGFLGFTGGCAWLTRPTKIHLRVCRAGKRSAPAIRQ